MRRARSRRIVGTLLSTAALTALLVGSGVGAAGGQATTPDPTVAAQADSPVGTRPASRWARATPGERGHQLALRLLQGRPEDR